MFRGQVVGLSLGLFMVLAVTLDNDLSRGLVVGLSVGLFIGLFLGLGLGLVEGLIEPRPVLLTSRTPKEANSRSLMVALTWMVAGLVVGLGLGLFMGLITASKDPNNVVLWLTTGLGLGLRNGGGFVLLQKVAHRHLARAGNLPPRPTDFLEWGIERQIFRRVGGGVRFRHSLIQQHLANSSEGALPGREGFVYMDTPTVSSSKFVQWLGLAALSSGILFVFDDLYSILYYIVGYTSPFRYPVVLAGPIRDLVVLAGALEIVGLIGLYTYRSNAVGIFGLTAFLITLFGEVGLFGVYLRLPIALESGYYSILILHLGWILLGVSFIRAQLYSCLATILLITSSLALGLLYLSDLLSEPHVLLTRYENQIFNILNNISIAWLGLALWTGRNVSSKSPTQQQPQREQLHQPPSG